MVKIISTLLLSILLLSTTNAQIGGRHVYQFLNLSNSARVTGLGGTLITVRDDDVNLAFSNPAVTNEKMHQQLSFSHNLFADGIGHGYAAYGHHAASINTSFHAGMQYTSYGEFDAADEFGTINGTFKANEYAFTVGAAREVYERLMIGANLKVITSQLESFNSFGLAADIAAVYQDTSGRFTATLLFKNAGAQLSTYTPDNREPIPFEVQAGVSQRFKHLPFRFSIIYQYINRENLTYDDPNTEETTFIIGDGSGDSDTPVADWLDNQFRHLVFSGEFLFGKRENLRLRFGYSHLLKQELTVNNFRSLAGFSFGAGVKINRFRVEYGRQIFHLAGGSNHFSITTNIKEFKGKKRR